jgi:putative ABC transport system permease protein
MLSDLRYALRGLVRNPGFAVAAILTLALGIGAVTSIFSVADAVLIRPLPYPKQDRLVMVWDQLTRIRQTQFPVHQQAYDSYRVARAFESAGVYRVRDVTLTGLGEASQLIVLEASPGLAEMLGASPAIGRGFTEQESQPGHGNVAILSHAFFMNRFGGRPDAIGRAITLDGRPFTIVGVMGADFEFSRIDEPPDVWKPMEIFANGQMGGGLEMIARLRPGVTIEAAQSEMDAIAQHLEETLHLYRGPNGEDPGYRVKVISLHEQLLGQFRTATILLLAAVVAVLLIALANVANLLLVRAVSREQEFSVRRAIGASEMRLARQWMTESAVLAVTGCVLGAIASVWGVRALVALSPSALPVVTRVGVDARALAITLALAVAVSILFGLMPLAAGRSNWRGAPRKKRTAPVLIAAEVALAMMLLIIGTQLLKSFSALRHMGTGFRAERLLTMMIELPAPRYAERQQRVAFYGPLHERLAALPGVSAVGIVRGLPVLGDTPQARGGNPFSIEGRPWDPASAVPQLAHSPAADPDYFRTMQIPLIAGREFTDRDTLASEPVAVVNVTLARAFFPRGAIGERIMLGAPRPGAPWLRIVGVVGDVQDAGLDAPSIPQFYRPMAQDASDFVQIVLRTAGDPGQMTRAAVAAIHSLDPDRPVLYIRTMEQRIAQTMSQPRFETLVVGFFAVTALLLAAVGIFGVVAHSTAQRTREIGIRMALGAGHGRVIRHVVLGGLRPVAAGAAIGIAGALGAGRMLASVLFHVKPTDPATFAAIAGVLAVVGMGACSIPAMRAARIDPASALRSE